MREAYSHEVISHGFWPGSGPVLEPAFYAYAVPEPDGFKAARVQPDAAFYHGELNEFILPYRGGLERRHRRRRRSPHSLKARTGPARRSGAGTPRPSIAVLRSVAAQSFSEVAAGSSVNAR